MSKSVSCIQMLLILNARQRVSVDELALLLGCKKRNIIEYKKELEAAGYSIVSARGKFGGYTLERGTLLPAMRFTPQEWSAIQEATLYMQTQPKFLPLTTYIQAMDKLQAHCMHEQEEHGYYMPDTLVTLSSSMRKAIQTCEKAKQKSCVVSLCYRSMHANKEESFLMQPYEIIYYKSNYYCLGYSLKAHAFRTYKFSDDRMKSVTCLQQHFIRENDFSLFDHIGKSGLVKQEVFELDLYIYQESARSIAERPCGIQPKMEWMDEETLHFTTIMEGKVETINFLLSLRNQHTLRSPVSLRQEMLGIIEDMKKAYVQSV